MVAARTLARLATVALFPRQAAATFRLLCPTFAQAYMDPIAAVGKKSTHLHSIAGALGFGDTVIPADMKAWNTTCNMIGDFSNYWAAAAYRTDLPGNPKTLLKPVFQPYYIFSGWSQHMDTSTLTAKPLEIIVGRYTGVRSTDNFRITFLIREGPDKIETESGRFGWHETGTDVREFTIHYFYPSCWDGRDYQLDQSHVTWPDEVTHKCPDGYQQFPMVRLEQRYILPAGYPMSWTNFEAPIVFSSGNATTAHADVVLFWDDATLKDLYTNCNYTYANCDYGARQGWASAIKNGASYEVPDQYYDGTRAPTPVPTEAPTKSPTRKPTLHMPTEPTPKPSKAPTRKPTLHMPTEPTAKPSKLGPLPPNTTPTPSMPTSAPTPQPTAKPTLAPTPEPTLRPTHEATPAPTPSFTDASFSSDS